MQVSSKGAELKWVMSWGEALEPMVSDLMNRSIDCDEFDKIAYLESVKRICEVYPEMPQLKQVRTELSRLKRKHRKLNVRSFLISYMTDGVSEHLKALRLYSQQ